MEVSYATKIAKRKYIETIMSTQDITFLECNSNMYGHFIYKVSYKEKVCDVIPIKIIHGRERWNHARQIKYRYFRDRIMRYCFKIITEERWNQLTIITSME